MHALCRQKYTDLEKVLPIHTYNKDKISTFLKGSFTLTLFSPSNMTKYSGSVSCVDFLNTLIVLVMGLELHILAYIHSNPALKNAVISFTCYIIFY